ncbi:MAG: acyl-CoA dehydrogenase family protein, partial [Candidatus Binatota bacterium]
MDLFFDREHLLLRRQVRSWVEKNLLPAGEKEADIEQQARKLVHYLGQEGFLAYVAPKRFGGIRENVQARDLCILREELARGSSLADTMFAVQALGSYPITVAGDEQQKRHYLPPIARG